jgi:tetratricopeptide (TPR) repeat protein
MKPKLLLLAVLAFITALLAFRFNDRMDSGKLRPQKRAMFSKPILRCTPDWGSLKEWLEETDIPPIPGAGFWQWKITTNNDSAQFYFNQGINTYYSFHIIESMASFKKAAKFDPSAAMLQWAQALAYGPNINDLGYAASPDALAATSKAIELSANCTDKEKMLIAAMQVRYSADSTQAREKLNQLYVDKLKEAHIKYPNDADVAALYADALMLQHPWDLWKVDGTPKPWTPLIREALEKLLAKTPNHPGANHYYIHVMEPSPFAYYATAAADRLGKLTPGLSHTVHMPSHIYLRTGEFEKGIKVNEEAIASYKSTIPIFSAVTGADFLYIIHNAHMQTIQSMMAGQKAYSVQSGIETVNSIPKDYLGIPGALGNYVQYIYMTPVMVDIRFGRWKELLERTQPDNSQVYGNVLYHFGRGMAHAGLANIMEAKMELAQLQQLMKDSVLRIPLSPFSAAIEGAAVAENLLAGTIAMKQKNFATAITFFQKAVTTEENMVYNEPRDWLLNPRQYLGNALLKAGKFSQAEKVFVADLHTNQYNGWGLYGLQLAQAAQKKSEESRKSAAGFRMAFAKADIKLTAPVF